MRIGTWNLEGRRDARHAALSLPVALKGLPDGEVADARQREKSLL